MSHSICPTDQCKCSTLHTDEGVLTGAEDLAQQLLAKADLHCPEHGWQPDALRVAAAAALIAQAAEIDRLNALLSAQPVGKPYRCSRTLTGHGPASAPC